MVKEITRKKLKAKIDRGTTSTSRRRSRGGSLRCREHKTPFLSGMCNLLQPPATIDRTLVAVARISGSSPLVGSLYCPYISQIREMKKPLVIYWGLLYTPATSPRWVILTHKLLPHNGCCNA